MWTTGREQSITNLNENNLKLRASIMRAPGRAVVRHHTQLRVLWPVRISFRKDGKIDAFRKMANLSLENLVWNNGCTKFSKHKGRKNRTSKTLGKYNVASLPAFSTSMFDDWVKKHLMCAHTLNSIVNIELNDVNSMEVRNCGEWRKSWLNDILTECVLFPWAHPCQGL